MLKKIMEKKELREIPIEDAEMALSLCLKKDSPEDYVIKCSRKILHSVYGAFGSRKLLNSKIRAPEEILRKHLSTRERLPYYGQIYGRFFRDLRGFRGTIFDLGAGVNGFSVEFLPNLRYVGIEGIGQLVKLMNSYFEKQKLNAIAVHLSLFQLEKIKQLIKKEKGKKIVFLFKVLDSLETLKRDYSKRLLLELSSLVDRVIISFATESMLRRKKFRVKRNWILDFISENFLIIDDFEIGGERYISFEKNK